MNPFAVLCSWENFGAIGEESCYEINKCNYHNKYRNH